MKRKITKEEAIARIKRMEWVQEEIFKCIDKRLPLSTLRQKGIEVCNFNTGK